MLETQISQVAQQQATIAASTGAYPGQPQPNPKGHANAITLRSGTKLDEPIDPRIQNLTMHQNSGKGSEKVNEPTKDGKKDESEAITQMPSYAKFLKGILSNKKNLEDDETVMLTAECSAIIQNNMPHKLKDPDSFSIPCVIRKFIIDKALCNLGANEDSHIPIILGSPFLATTGAIIDVKKGRLTFEVGEEKVKFLLAKFLQAPAIDESCYFLDVIDECVKEMDKESFKYTEVLKIPTPPIFEAMNKVSHK
ncbi:uncharacterized protein LOC127094781 [Lathyrus oleraceus]|uniref:uncharacterized protein LOC127094781 n=1 Tax=Pisum sativum TaxID=3888 RepID=UPI0021D362D6|nr:uncharacterized protein LOC127094781 [Pisum sativum]